MVENNAIHEPAFPGGTVTFLFTDIEGSTQLLEKLRDQYEVLISGHHQIIRDTLSKWNGREIDTQGDAFFIVFPRASEAVCAVVDIQRAMHEGEWPEGAQVRVRMGLHTGEPWLVEEGYMGMDVHRAARIGHVGYGGQVLLSDTTTSLVLDELPEGVFLLDLGRHRLKDMRRPEPIHQLVIEGLPFEFPPLNSLEALPALQPAPTDKEAPGAPREVGPSPFRGLAAFRETDSEIFFGREAFVEQLSEAVGQRHLVAVIVGPSGSGKSSTVFAGLLPQIRAENKWLIVETRPGSRPFHALAGALIPNLESESSETKLLVETRRLAKAMRTGELGLFQIINYILAQDGKAERVLLVIDQFEELFTHKPDPDAQRYFLDELIAAAEAGSSYRRSPLVILLTLRADFMGQALGHRPFADALQEGSLILGPMNRDELRAAVEKPAELAGAAFETGLVQRILDDVGQEPGNLPLLEFALTLLWERMEQGWMTHADYDEIGRVDGALARYAEEVWTGLDSEEQQAARPLFVQLVQPGEGTEDTRRVARRAELAEGQWPLVQHLADMRLVVTGQDEAGEETIEVVHEALIRGWDRLREWMIDDRSFRTWQEGLRVALRGWEVSDHDEGALLRGAPLALALEWLGEQDSLLAPIEKEFIVASNTAKQKRQAEEEARRQRELETAQKLAETEHARAEEQARSAYNLRRRAYILGGVLLIAAILAVAAVFFAQRSNENADLATTREAEALVEASQRATAQASAEEEAEQRATAEADALIQKSVAEDARENSLRQAAIMLANQSEADLAAGNHDRAVLLALEALENFPYTAQAEHALGQAVTYNRALQQYAGHSSAATSVSWSPDSKKIASSASTDNNIHIWDPATGKLQSIIDLPTGITGNIYDMVLSVAWTPGSNRLVVLTGDRFTLGSQDFDLHLIDVNSGELLSSVEIPNQAAPASGELQVSFVRYTTGSAIDINPFNGRIATLGGDNTALIWDDGLIAPEIVLAGHSDAVNSVAWSRDGSELVTAGMDSTARVWDASNGEEQLVLEGHEGRVNAAIWSPDGELLATAGDDSTVRIWDVENGRLESLIEPETESVWSLAWSPDGNRLLIGQYEGQVTIWEVSTGELLETISGHTGFISDLSWSPVDDRVASSDNSGFVRIWNMAPNTAWRTFPVWFAQGVDWSGDGRYLIVAGGDVVENTEPPSFAIWDVAADQVVEEDLAANLHYKALYTFFSPDEEEILYAGLEGFPNMSGLHKIYVVDARTGEILRDFSAEEGNMFRSFNWSPDGSQVAGGMLFSDDIWIFDSQSGEVIQKLSPANSDMMINYLQWSPDGSKLAAGGDDGMARVWNAQNWELMYTIDGHETPAIITNVTWSPDGKKLMTTAGNDEKGAKDNTARIWDGDSGEELMIMNGHTKLLQFGTWSPDSSRVATASNDGTVRIWDVETGKELLNLDIPTLYGSAVWWSPDGQHLAIAGLGTQTSIWRVWQTTEELIEYAKECCIFRELSPEEREQFGLTIQ